MMNVSEAMAMLWEHARPNLGTEDLQKLSEGLNDSAQFYVGDLRDAVEHVACLVMMDSGETTYTKSGEPVLRSGAMDGAGSAPLLLTITAHLDMIAGMLEVAGESDYLLREKGTSAEERQGEQQ